MMCLFIMTMITFFQNYDIEIYGGYFLSAASKPSHSVQIDGRIHQ